MLFLGVFPGGGGGVDEVGPGRGTEDGGAFGPFLHWEGPEI